MSVQRSLRASSRRRNQAVFTGMEALERRRLLAGPNIDVNDISVNEGNFGTTPATFTVSLSAPATVTTNVNYATHNDTAISGVDFVGQRGMVTFAPGEDTQPVTIQVIGNITPQPDRDFFLFLTSATSGTIGKGQGVCTIKDDDSNVVQPTVSVDNPSATEAAGATLNFTVSLSNQFVAP